MFRGAGMPLLEERAACPYCVEEFVLTIFTTVEGGLLTAEALGLLPCVLPWLLRAARMPPGASFTPRSAGVLVL